MASFYLKDPDAILDYKFDWAALTNGSGSSDWLDTDNGETIDSHTIIADTGITVDSSSVTDSNTSVKVWLSDGTVSNYYGVTCRIVTSASRTDDRTMKIKIQER